MIPKLKKGKVGPVDCANNILHAFIQILLSHKFLKKKFIKVRKENILVKMCNHVLHFNKNAKNSEIAL